MQSQFIHYKIINRSYWTPCKLAKLRLRDNDACWRCGKEAEIIVHLLYYCEKTGCMWGEITVFLNKMLKIPLIKTSALCLLGLLPEDIRMTNHMSLWLKLDN